MHYTDLHDSIFDFYVVSTIPDFWSQVSNHLLVTGKCPVTFTLDFWHKVVGQSQNLQVRINCQTSLILPRP